MKVVLKSDSELLDEVMVVAYGTAKKSSYAGSASLVKADALKDIPTTSFENALNGKVAGLQLTNNSGQAGSAPAIRIRGIGSMNAGNEPLYVVDGVPVSSGNTGQMSGELYSTNNIMNTLNPEDIESISVLKDAAASSLYGSRAANGVILITTKKGQIGKPKINYNGYVGIQNITRYPEYYNGYEYATLLQRSPAEYRSYSPLLQLKIWNVSNKESGRQTGMMKSFAKQLLPLITI